MNVQPEWIAKARPNDMWWDVVTRDGRVIVECVRRTHAAKLVLVHNQEREKFDTSVGVVRVLPEPPHHVGQLTCKLCGQARSEPWQAVEVDDREYWAHASCADVYRVS